MGEHIAGGKGRLLAIPSRELVIAHLRTTRHSRGRRREEPNRPTTLIAKLDAIVSRDQLPANVTGQCKFCHRRISDSIQRRNTALEIWLPNYSIIRPKKPIMLCSAESGATASLRNKKRPLLLQQLALVLAME
jgi:hypothetical protein